VDDVVQFEDVGVLEFFEQGDFSDCCAWDSFFDGLKPYFFECDDFSSFEVYVTRIPFAL
jgi:hypothetical protein